MSQGWDWGGHRQRGWGQDGGSQWGYGKPEEVPGPAWGAGVVREGFLEKGMSNLKPIRGAGSCQEKEEEVSCRPREQHAQRLGRTGILVCRIPTQRRDISSFAYSPPMTPIAL